MAKGKIVGIVNITPDSFSDGGLFFSPDKALERIHGLIAEGADVIDIGAESTRPGASPLTPEQEWQRLEPVLSVLPSSVCFSLDTRHAATARKALAIPSSRISWINDVSGFADGAMTEAVKHSRCKLVVMHSLSVPADKNMVMDSPDAVADLLAFAKNKIAVLEAAGIAKERIIFDPGIGFGKTPAQSWDIIRGVSRFAALGVPILMGHSRKSFLHRHPALPRHPGEGRDPRLDSDAATLAVSQFLIERDVDFIRVHNVAAHKHLLSLMDELYHG